MNHQRGFTLIEILIALTIFALLAAMTSGTLYRAFDTRDRINQQANRLSKLQYAITLIERDAEQMSPRGIRTNHMRPSPPFIGDQNYVEFTRDGVSNPLGLERRSSLKRIALLCKDGQLLRRTWPVLDPVRHDQFVDKVLLDELKTCEIKYLDKKLVIQPLWTQPDTAQKIQTVFNQKHRSHNRNRKKPPPFPKAIQLNIELTTWGKGNFLFLIPEAVYGHR